MDIHVYSARIQRKKKKGNRVLSFHQSGVVAFAYGPGDKTTFDRPSVYEHELLTPVLPAKPCLTDETGNPDFARGSAINFDKALQQFVAIQVPNTITERCSGR